MGIGSDRGGGRIIHPFRARQSDGIRQRGQRPDSRRQWHEKKLGPGADQILNGTVPREFGSDRAKLEESVARIDGLLAKIVADYRTAAAKFDEGKKASKGEVVAEYMDLMSQAYQNRSSAAESRRKIAALLLDKSIPSNDERRRKADALNSDVFKAEREFEVLDEKAGQLREENKNSFGLGKM